ncbi:hypothetical protein AgCh_008189 [Apium graveolens]
MVLMVLFVLSLGVLASLICRVIKWEVVILELGLSFWTCFSTRYVYGVEKSNNQAAFSPPFFMGSPPSRASNPVVQDAHFGIDKPISFSTASEASPSSQRNNAGCSRVKFGQKPAAVRIEGFNCRGNNCGISAVA